MFPLPFAPFLAQAPGPTDSPTDAVARAAQELFAHRPETSLAAVGLILLAAIVIQILAYWIAAKVIVGHENGTLARATYLWLLSVIAAIGMAFVFAFAFVAAASTQKPILMLLVVGGWSLLALLIAVLLPAKVFETGLLRSVGILVLSFVLVLAGQTALDQALGRSALARWQPVRALIFESQEGRQRRLKHLLSGDTLATIEADLDRLASPEERAKSFTERQAGLRAVFAALEQRRKAIKPNDAEALASYEAVRQRYEELVKIMRADYAASPAPPPRPPQTAP